MATRISEIEFMRLAIQEAKKSISEDKQVHPYVGAVVVFKKRVLNSAHRGENLENLPIDHRKGKKDADHAEYHVLEKKLPTQTLAGCTVYTTLEPCTTRNHPKVPCASRLIERRVSRVVIGMLDPNQAITGKGVLQLRQAGIAVDLFPPNLMSELEELNRDFIRTYQSKLPDSLAIGITESGLTAFYPSREYYSRLRHNASTIDQYVDTAKKSAVLISINLITGIQFHELCSCLENKLKNPPDEFCVTISLLDPRIQELMSVMAPVLNMEPGELSQSIQRSIKELFRLKQRLPDNAKNRCDIRVHKTIPFGSAIMLDHHEANGKIQIETKPYKSGLQNSFAFEITRNQKNHLYDTLSNSYDILLAEGESLKKEII